MKRVLIANRGEIALRIYRACRSLGLEVVAAFSKVDKDLVHLPLCDDRICIGQRTYLDAKQMVAAAAVTGCDAVHPGYGFLSENATFAELVESSNMTFVGPTSNLIAMMGDKATARQTMSDSGVPVLPGSRGAVSSVDEAHEIAAGIGYPVMLKAAHGGGGMGIRMVKDTGELDNAWQAIGVQAESLFGNSEIYMEKFVENARHIEIQVMGDGDGKVVHFGARDCSVQRRNQKLLEETPPAGIDGSVIDALAESCVTALSALRYDNAGTLEFLYRDGSFYFIEMNTRIQVEHPITEVVTGIDLVKLQLQLAAGQPLELDQADIQVKGHAIECRITAEDESFLPSPGLVEKLVVPGGPGVRFDSHLYTGYKVPHEYDSLIAKLVVCGNSRDEAIQRCRVALEEMVVAGPETNKRLLLKILDSSGFQAGDYSTDLIGQFG